MVQPHTQAGRWPALSLGALLWVLLSSPAAARLTHFSQGTPGAAIPPPWYHQPLPGVERDNRFSLVADEGRTVLQIRSERAASTLAHPLELDLQTSPVLRWRWKVSAPVTGSDFTRKAGDDYAARVYVLFDYPLARLNLGERLKLKLARALYDDSLPAAAIAYVWGSAQPAGALGPNPYTDRVRMVVLQSGAGNAGRWVTERRDVAADFQAAFGEPAPPVQGIAIGADTDNTGEAVTAWFGDLEFVASPQTGE